MKKNILFLLIGFTMALSINAITPTIPPTKIYTEKDYLTLPEERLYEEINFLENKVEVSQEIIYLLIELGNKYPEFNNDIYDVLFEMDITEYAYDLDIRFFRDDTIENKAEMDYIEY